MHFTQNIFSSFYSFHLLLFVFIFFSLFFIVQTQPSRASEYLIPLPIGKQIITNGYEGHNTYLDWPQYSLDFQSAEIPKGISNISEARCFSYGEPILSAKSGAIKKVISLANRHSKSAGYGAYVQIKNDNGTTAIYGHMINDSNKEYVKTGDQVRAGQIIGLMGDTGNVSENYKKNPCSQDKNYGTHLHFELRGDKTPPEPMGGYRNISAQQVLVSSSRPKNIETYVEKHFGKYPYIPKLEQIHSITPLTAKPNSRTTFLIKGKYFTYGSDFTLPFCKEQKTNITNANVNISCLTSDISKIYEGSFTNLYQPDGKFYYKIEITKNPQNSPKIKDVTFIPPKPGEMIKVKIIGSGLSGNIQLNIQSENDKTEKGKCNFKDQFIQLSSNKIIAQCQIPLNIGPVKQTNEQNFFLKISELYKSNKTLYKKSFSINYGISSPILSPLQATYSTPTRFTISGKNVHRTTVFFIEGCEKKDMRIIEQQFDRVVIECRIQTLPNTDLSNLENKSFSHKFLFKTQSRYDEQGNTIVSEEEDLENTIISGYITLMEDTETRIDSISPQTAIIGEETTFTIKGNRLPFSNKNLPLITLENCSGEKGSIDIIPGSFSGTGFQFRCTPFFTKNELKKHQELKKRYESAKEIDKKKLWSEFQIFFSQLKPRKIRIKNESQLTSDNVITVISSLYRFIREEEQFQFQYNRKDSIYKISGPAEISKIKINSIDKGKRHQKISIFGKNLPYDLNILSKDCAQTSITFGSSERFEAVCLLKKVALEELQIIDQKKQEELYRKKTKVIEFYTAKATVFKNETKKILLEISGVNLKEKFHISSPSCSNIVNVREATSSQLLLSCEILGGKFSFPKKLELKIQNLDKETFLHSTIDIIKSDQDWPEFYQTEILSIHAPQPLTLNSQPSSKKPILSPALRSFSVEGNSLFKIICDSSNDEEIYTGYCEITSPFLRSARIMTSLDKNKKIGILEGEIEIKMNKTIDIISKQFTGLKLMPGKAKGLIMVNGQKQNIVINGDIKAIGFDATDVLGFPFAFDLQDYSGNLTLSWPKFDIKKTREKSRVIMGIGENEDQVIESFRKFQKKLKKHLNKWVKSANSTLQKQKIMIGKKISQSIKNKTLRKNFQTGYLNILKALQIVPEKLVFYDNYDVIAKGKLKSEPFRPSSWKENQGWIAEANLATIDLDFSAKEGKIQIKGQAINSLSLFNNEIFTTDGGLLNAGLIIDLKKDEGRIDIDQIQLRLPGNISSIYASAHFTHILNPSKIATWGNITGQTSLGALKIYELGGYWQYDPNQVYIVDNFSNIGILRLDIEGHMVALTSTGKAVITKASNQIIIDLGGAVNLDFFGYKKRLGDILSRTRIASDMIKSCMNSQTGELNINIPFTDKWDLKVKGGLSLRAEAELQKGGRISPNFISISGQVSDGSRIGINYDHRKSWLTAFSEYHKKCEDTPEDNFLNEILANTIAQKETIVKKKHEIASRILPPGFFPSAKAAETETNALWNVQGWKKLEVKENESLEIQILDKNNQKIELKYEDYSVPGLWKKGNEFLFVGIQEFESNGYQIQLSGSQGNLMFFYFSNEEETVKEYNIQLSNNNPQTLEIQNKKILLNKKSIQAKKEKARYISQNERQVKAEVSSEELKIPKMKTKKEKTIKKRKINKSEIKSKKIASSDLFPDIISPILREAVLSLTQAGIINGYPDNTFRPENTINRAEALKLIFATVGLSKRSKATSSKPSPVLRSFSEEGTITPQPSTQSSFPDVSSDAWYSPYINEAKEKNIIKGYPDGTFKPDKEVNRAEFIKMTMLAQDFYLEPSEHSKTIKQYSDLDPNAWYMPTISFGLLNNFLPKRKQLKPFNTMTRGDATLIIFKIYKYKNELLTWYKNP